MILERLRAGLATRYRVEGALGAGGMATVWLAEDVRHHRKVALKVLRPELAAEIGPDRFLREIEISAGLLHPHILPLFDSGECNGLLYFVMPWVEGPSLRERIDQQTLIGVEEALRITAEVGGALAYAHGREVVHRDVKPANILLEGGHAIVTDFGVAHAVLGAGNPGVTIPGMMLGTPLYMSPEQAAGDPDLDGRSDQYSLACVLFEMLCGATPFAGATADAILVQRFTLPPPRLSARRDGLPRRLDAALYRAMARDRVDRFPSVERFVEALSESGSRPVEVGGKSIAVLPFVNSSGRVEDEFFSDGITEEIINVLAQIAGLHVAARTSSFSFKGKNVDLRLIGEKLNVTTVLEGSVRKAGNRLRITAQLVDVADGYQLWSERYDRELTDVFGIQDEIATAIASKLKVTLSGSPEPARRGTANLEAYECFLKGRALQWRRGRWVVPALECFEKAVALDPLFADSYAGMSDSHRLLGLYGARRPEDSMPLAKAFAERALSLDQELADAHATLAGVSLVYDRDYPAAKRSWERALEIEPRHVRARCEYALWWLTIVSGAYGEAVSVAENALKDDPLSSWAAAMLSLVLSGAGRSQDAIVEGQRAIELDPESFLARFALLNAYGFARDFARAIASGQGALPASGRHPFLLGRLAGAYGGSGDREAAEAVHQELQARARTEYVQTYWLAATTAATGHLDEAMALAFRALDERDPVFITLGILPEWDPLRSHPRFGELMSRAGLAWRAGPRGG